MNELQEKLKLVECPFNWNLVDVMETRKSASIIIEDLMAKEEDMPEHGILACIQLTLAYLHSVNQDIKKATEVLNQCESNLNSSSDNLIVKYKPAFESVYNASRASLLLASLLSTPSEVKMFSDKVVRVEDLDLPNQAAIYAIKAHVFSEFGVRGTMAALEHAEEALKRNSKEADWHFLMGKLLSRRRHFSQIHEINPKELFHLKRAYDLAETARHAVFLATAYVKRSKSVYYEALKIGKERVYEVSIDIRRLTDKAKELAKIALDKNQNRCPRILTRCAYVYTKLPKSDREIGTAKQLLELSLKLNPNDPMASKTAGDICLLEDEPKYHEALEHYKNAAARKVFSANLDAFDLQLKLNLDLDALEHYKNAAARKVFSANLDAFDLQLKLNLDLDAESFYGKMLEQYKESIYQMLIFLHAAAYYIFIPKDLCKSVNYFMKVIEIDPSFYQLTGYWIKSIRKFVNLYEIISNEVRHAIACEKFNGAELNLLKNARERIFEIKPELKEVPVVANKVQDILDEHEMQSAQSLERQRNFRWQRRGRGGRGRGRW